MHTLWLRQHNLIAEQLSQITDWDAARIFQETRKIVGAQIQVITYNEFLPLILGQKTVNKFMRNDVIKKEQSKRLVNVIMSCYHAVYQIQEPILLHYRISVPPIAKIRVFRIIQLWITVQKFVSRNNIKNTKN